MIPRGFRRWALPVQGWGRICGIEGGEPSAGLPPLLLLHGFTGSSLAWGGPLLTTLAARTRVVAVDLPGHGGSDLPPAGRPPTVPGVVELLEELAGRLSLLPAVWVGYSMGGRVALAAAVLRSAPVAGLVLESSSPGLESEEARRERRVLDEGRARSLEAGGMEPFVEEWLASPLFQGLQRLPEAERLEERERRLRNRPGALAAVLRGMGTGSQSWLGGDATRVTVPTLLLAGALDPRYVDEARRMERMLPHGRVVEVPGAGHVVHREAPAAWLGAVLSFLTRRFGLPPGGDGEGFPGGG